MHVTVKLFATLSSYGPSKRAGTPFGMELSEGATLDELIGQLGIPPGASRVIFVNGIGQEPDCELHEGDEVGIFPPIGGG